MKKIALIYVSLWMYAFPGHTQNGYWQQHVKYSMKVDMNVQTNRFTGIQKLAYTNNSPDTLKKVFYHLYWNAFQPGSMMDVRNRELTKIKTSIQGWDDVQKDRILHLKPEEIGYQKVTAVSMNGVSQKYQVDETILEVFLSKAILPHTTVIFDLNFEAQVPLQVRRSGRDNPQTGVRYSISQWYPKICEYDAEGWHPTPYVAREFYGAWGDYDVAITIDKNYVLGGTGDLLNPEKIGYGYEKPGSKILRTPGNKLTWHFVARNVHDFMWAADSGYRHLVRHVPRGPDIHILYVNHHNNLSLDTSWNLQADAVVKIFPFIEQHFGKYPYKQFSIIQGGDGGMEYPMAVLVSDDNIGRVFHELMHQWYYGMLGTNETLYAWMDEGFACYAYDLVWDHYLDWYVSEHPENTRAKQIRDYFSTLLPTHHADQYQKYFELAKSGIEEPLSTHADHYNTIPGYEIGVYAKGDVFLTQLGYIVGDKMRDSILLEYYRQWRFKHPDANDFIRLAEKLSGLQLDWYKEYWLFTTKTIDYGIDSTWEENNTTKIRLKMEGKMPMPLDVQVELKDGRKEINYIAQYLMFGGKNEDAGLPKTICIPWKWTDPYYILSIKRPLADLKTVEIDPSQRMADVNRANNKRVF